MAQELDKEKMIERALYISELFKSVKLKMDEYTAFALADMCIFVCKEGGMTLDQTVTFFNEIIEFNKAAEEADKREVH